RTAHASSRVTSLSRLSKLSGTLGRPSGKRSPFHSGVRKMSSSFDICCAVAAIPESIIKVENSRVLFIRDGLCFSQLFKSRLLFSENVIRFTLLDTAYALRSFILLPMV